jgi:HK97 family phage prohead protease
MKIRPVERRFTSGEVEVRQHGSETVIEGHAAVFNKLSQNLGGFVERVMPGAFAKTLGEADIRALYNHDENLVLGRNTSGTLDLAEDDSGLYYRIRPPDTSYARDLMTVINRGDVSQSSFSFIAIDEEWGLSEQDFPRRDLVAVHLVDVAPVTYPAYLDTDTGTGGRTAALAGLASRTGVSVSRLADRESIRRVLAGGSLNENRAEATDPKLAALLGQADQAIDDAMESLSAADLILDDVLLQMGLADPEEDPTEAASAPRHADWARRAETLAHLESALNDSAE